MNNYKSRSLLVLLFMLLPGLAAAQSFTETRKIVRRYSVNQHTTLDITNKYGKIHLVSWDKDSVMIEANLMVKTSNSKKLDKIVENVDFEFTGTEYYIIAKTVFGSKYYNLFDEIRNITDAIFPTDNQVMIDYLVMLPRKINLKIDNRYGDVYADDLSGDIRIVLYNGDMKANNISGKVDLSLSMADVSLNQLPDANLLVNYSDIQIKQAGKLVIDSRLSKINIEQTEEIKLNSRRDKLYVNRLNKLFGESYFSDTWIYEFLREANFKMKYGNLNLENIHPAFSFINLNSEFADLNLYFRKESAYQLDITHKETPLRYPAGISKLEEKTFDAADKVMLTNGYVNNKDAKAVVRIAAVKGSINIIHK